MAKTSLTLVLFLFATLFGFVSARPLERRTVPQLKEDFENVSRSINMFDRQVSMLEVFSPCIIFQVVLDAISSGFASCADALIDVDSLSDGDSQDILEQMQSFSPTFVSAMNRMAAASQTAHGLAAPAAKRDLGQGVQDINSTLNTLGNNLKRTVQDLLRKSPNKQQKAAYQQMGDQMEDAIHKAHSHK